MAYDSSLQRDLQPTLEGRIFRAPDGVALRHGPHGLGLYTTRSVNAGEVIYSSGWFTVPDEEHSYRALAEVDGEIREVEVTTVHSVKYGDTRTFDIPGCFMNHACEPTSISIDRVIDDGDEVTVYDQVALINLDPGDPITCDYTLFDWDCDGHQFTCACGAMRCYGDIAGFAGLPADLQRELEDRISYESARMWTARR